MSATAAGTLEERWQADWPEALATWSRYTQIRDPLYLADDQAAKPYGMSGEIAAIRLADQLVMVNLAAIRKLELEDFAREILAHEIGHHMLVPANLTDNARMIAAIHRVCKDLHQDIPHFVANLYGDLLINDRLQRLHGLDMAGVYKQLKAQEPKGATSRVWKLYLRCYEHLWRLPAGTLAPVDLPEGMDGDARLIMRLIRHFSANWLRGAWRFASILYPWLKEDQDEKIAQTFSRLGLEDTRGAGKGAGKDGDAAAIPDGLAEIDASELEEWDEFDEVLAEELGRDAVGRGPKRVKKAANAVPDQEGGGHKGNLREPYEYGELLKALGLNLSAHEVTTRYYRERALPHLIPFPSKRAPRATEPLAEGYETWEPGQPLHELDLFGSVMASPHVIPGVTTVQRVYGEQPGADPRRIPMDLDLYVDCSGSMPEPSRFVSYLALAGTILALSALRAGARVQATLWSGAGQFDTSRGFIRDEKRILGIVTGYICGGTCFPLHVLRDTYRDRAPDEPPAHIVVISDEGVDTMLAHDEWKTPGEEIAKAALHAARGGGTLALNLWGEKWAPRSRFEKLGFKVHAVREMAELIRFARAFVRENYGD